MMTLTQRCLELPYRERLNLCSVLRDSIILERKDGRKRNPTRADILLDMMAQILGEPVQLKPRNPRFAWARKMVAYQLIREGYSTHEVGEMIGKDHSSVVAMKKKMQDALNYPQAYRDVVDIWKQFQNKIHNDIHKGTTQDLIHLGG